LVKLNNIPDHISELEVNICAFQHASPPPKKKREREKKKERKKEEEEEEQLQMLSCST
jgi:ribosomal protein L12E/L44/L45/RPP1/RPP2